MMRLINVHTLKLEVFSDHQIPPYAALSHTWGSDHEELKIHDVARGKIPKSGIGQEKFHGCCEQAKKDHLKYIWIDTCCIDQGNLVELSEAINSMFRWYERASACYAYLSDVPGNQNPRGLGSKFRESRWFRRGWTLQELLAPRRLVFYSREWHNLGTKVDLCTVVEEVTGISSPFLRGIDDLQSASVAQRMAWAAHRNTKREEDLSYCLLGIFGISMPMIYGEGGDRAFFRLQEHIIRSTRDHSVLAWGFDDRNPPGSAGQSRAGGVFAAAPSDFANSGHIVPRTQTETYLDLLEISGGSLRVSLSVVDTTAETIGLLNCGPEGDIEQAVAIPLRKLALGGSTEYTRPRGYHSVLRPVTVSSDFRQFIRVKIDQESNSQIHTQTCWLYDDYDLADVDLKLIDVEPKSSWCEDQAYIKSTPQHTDSTTNLTLARLRHSREGPWDFVLILEPQQQGNYIDTCSSLAICSRNISLKDLRERMHLPMQSLTGKRTASDVLVNLQLRLEPTGRRPTFTMKLETILQPPDITFDASHGQQKSYLALEIESMLHKQTQPGERQQFEYSNESYEIEKINGQPPFLYACENGDFEICKLLHDNGIDTAGATGSRTPLAMASKNGHTDVVRLLLATGKFHVDFQDRESGRTALSWAAEGGHEDIVRLLLEMGADIDLTDILGRTALSYAAEKSHKTAVHLLFKSGAAIDHGTAARQLLWTLQGHRNNVLSITFSRDSKLLASTSKDRTIWLWDAEAGQPRHVLEGHWNDVLSVTFSPDSKLLASTSMDRTVRLWSLETGLLKHVLEGDREGIKSIAFSHDAVVLASASGDDRTIRLWNIETGQLKRTLGGPLGHQGGINSVAFSNNSKLLASASEDCTVRLWNMTTLRPQVLWGHTKGVQLTIFSNDSKLLASVSLDRTILLWDVEKYQTRAKLWGHTKKIRAAAFSHNSKLFASASEDQTIRLWKTSNGELYRSLWNHKGDIWSIAFSHDSKLLASASNDRTIRLWDTASGQLLQTLWGHGRGVQSVAFSYDSELLASASADHTVRIWEKC